MKSLMVVFAVSLTLFGSACGLHAAESYGDIAQACDIEGGLIVHLGFEYGDSSVPGGATAQLGDNERYLIQGLSSNPAKVREALAAIGETERAGRVTFQLYNGKDLPYKDNLVNLIVLDGPLTVEREELMRVLAPKGVIYAAGKQISNPWPSAMDEWSHYLHSPDNNAVSQDETIAVPRGIQWKSGPKWSRTHEELAGVSSAVSSGGRIFYIQDVAPQKTLRFPANWQLTARDAFNGVLLWQKSVTPWIDTLRHFRTGPAFLPRGLVADSDYVYATLGLGKPLKQIDAATGEVLQTYPGTEYTEEIILANGTLYILAGTSEIERRGGGLHTRGEPEPSGFRWLAAIDPDTGRQLWRKDMYVLPQSFAVQGDRLVCQNLSGLECLDSRTGAQIWKAPRSTLAKRPGFLAPTLVIADDVVLSSDRVTSSKNEKNLPISKDGTVTWGIHGWGAKGFSRHGKSEVRAYSLDTGKQLWSARGSEAYNTPVSIFVIGEVAWIGQKYDGYDLHTGEKVLSLDRTSDPVSMGHHRCYPDKATKNYLLFGQSGIEVFSFTNGWQGNNSWIRGTCQYGVLPANGLIYAPHDPCACNSKARIQGFFAATTAKQGKNGGMPAAESGALQKGPAYGRIKADLNSERGDWPTYRGDMERSGATKTEIAGTPHKIWSRNLGGKLTQPVISGGRLFVAQSERHTLAALDAQNGDLLWKYMAGARIDSSPTIYKGRVLFGSADGWVYCLRASDGELAWRFRAAPRERMVVAFNQLESVWPLHGTVLVQNDIVYVAAGRNSYLDGGIALYRLDPLTGKPLGPRKVLSDVDPQTGEQTGREKNRSNDMAGINSDILLGNGEAVFMKHLCFDNSFERLENDLPHLLSSDGLLGENWFVRAYWILGTQLGTGWGGWARSANLNSFGRIISYDDKHVYGYGRQHVSGGRTGHNADHYRLFCNTKLMVPTEPLTKKQRRAGNNRGQPKPETIWNKKGYPMTVRAMTATLGKLAIAGVPNLGDRKKKILAYENGEEALEAYAGKKGASLEILDAKTGSQLSKADLESMPVFDGLSAANGKLFISLKNGSVQCWGK